MANLSISVSTPREAIIGNWYETNGGTRVGFNNDATGFMSQHFSGLVIYSDFIYTATDTSTTITFANNGQITTMPYSISSDMNTLTLSTPSSNGSTYDVDFARGNPAFPVESWTIDWGNSDTVQVGSYVEIKTQAIPDYTTDEISWTFSDNTLGNIAMNPGQRKARLTGRAPGTLTVTATMGGTSYSHTYTVTSN